MNHSESSRSAEWPHFRFASFADPMTKWTLELCSIETKPKLAQNGDDAHTSPDLGKCNLKCHSGSHYIPVGVGNRSIYWFLAADKHKKRGRAAVLYLGYMSVITVRYTHKKGNYC